MVDIEEVVQKARADARLHVCLGLYDLDPKPDLETRMAKISLGVEKIREAFTATSEAARKTAANMEKIAQQFEAAGKRVYEGA